MARRRKLKIKPLGERVLVKISLPETKTVSGLFIPQAAQEKTQEGIIEAIGEDVSISLKVNDKVMYDKYAGTPVKIEGVEHLILDIDSIIAVIE